MSAASHSISVSPVTSPLTVWPLFSVIVRTPPVNEVTVPAFWSELVPELLD
jgi:hypothetical protein